MLAATDQLLKAAQYRPLIIAYRNGAPIRLSSVADVMDSVEDIRGTGLSNGKPAVLLIIFRQPGANIIEAADRVLNLMPQLSSEIPADMHLSVVLDRTSTIRASVHDTETTLLLSISLVVMVVFLFLRNWRSDADPQRGRSRLIDRHVRRDVSHGLQHRQPFTDGTHHCDRICR